MTSHSLSEVGDISFALQNDSSSGATFHDHYRDSNVEDIPQILRAKRPKVQAQGGESYGSATTIDTLPGDVLLEIFYSYQTDQDTDEFWPTLVPASCRWIRLVHVCRRWRQIVLGSPRRLDLQLLCTHRTPVRTDLSSLPPFPLAIEHGHHQRLTSYDEDNLFAALEHLGRICHVNLSLPSSQLSKVATKMQESFPALKHLTLLSEDKNALVLPDGFLGGAAPCLQRIALGGIIFPTLPTLLSSSSNLVGLKLYDIPRNGYISPEAMITYLATLPRLETFHIGFQSATSRPDRIRTPPETRTPLPSLTSIEFRGASEYLEELVSRIDSPQLNQIHISYLNQLADFQVAQPFKFIDRSEGPELTLLEHADVTFTNRSVSLDLYQCPPHSPNRVPIRTSILCQGIDWQVSHIAQVFSHRPTILSHVVDLELNESGADEDCQLESVENAAWLHLLRQFSAVRTLHVSGELAGHVALALEDITEETVSEVLPALNSIISTGGPSSRSFDKFVAVRRLSGRPVTVIMGDGRLWHARRLWVQFMETIPNDGMVSLQNRITMTTEMRVGLDSKRRLSKRSHAQTCRKHAEKTFHSVKTASDRARDTEFGVPQDGTYDEQMRRTIDVAEATYRCFLGSKDPFPTLEQASNWAKSVWPIASTKTGTRLSPPDDLADRLAVVVSRFLTNVKAKVTPLVTKFYGFETGEAAEILNRNTERAQNLKTDTTFINGEHGIPYPHPIIQQCIDVVWFGDRHGEGVRFPNEFNPMPYEAIALVLTAIECCLDEWSNGVQTELPFTYERYKVTYMSHLTALKALTQQGLNTRHCDPLHQLRRDFYDEGRKHAGVLALAHTSQATHNIWPQDRVNAACQGLLAS